MALVSVTGAAIGERADSVAVVEEREPRKPLYSRPVARRRGLTFQSRILLLTLAGGLPAVAQPVEVTVESAAELREALKPGQEARTIRLLAGRYVLDAPLVVPDGVELVGVGVMRADSDGLPTGFAPGAGTVLVASERLEGDVVALGDRTRLQNLRVESPAANADEPRAGNLVVITSRRAGDRVKAMLSECEIINHTSVGFSPAGPTGHTIAVLTRNPGAGAPWHEGARVMVAIERSLVRSMTGVGSVFAINFASAGSIELDFERSRFEGSVGIVGGVARPDPVRGASTVLRSRGNLYVKDGGTEAAGWGILGASWRPTRKSAVAVPSRARCG